MISSGNTITISGENRITISGNDLHQVFYVNTGATLNLINLLIIDGTADYGGGLYNAGTVNIAGSTFSNNTAILNGGAISNASILTVTRSTFTGNSAGSDAGGIANTSVNALAILSNSTFASNHASYGGGLHNNSGTMNIVNSTLSGNYATNDGGGLGTWKGGSSDPITYVNNTIISNSTSGGDCHNYATGQLFGSYNLIENTSTCLVITSMTTDPKLGTLTGLPAYFPLLDGSPALNVGEDGNCAGPPVSGTSQNGYPRPQGTHCDIGSVEAAVKVVFRSIGSADGWILESSRTSSVGGSFNPTSTTLRIGDDEQRRQFRSILSFNTGTTLPDNAVITGVTLKVKQEFTYGSGSPLTLLGGFKVDIRKGTFGTLALQATDFQALALQTYGPFNPPLVSSWYTLKLTNARTYINKLAAGSGATQIRLRFALGDNPNAIANYLTLFSGNAVLANRPQLIVYYYIP